MISGLQNSTVNKENSFIELFSQLKRYEILNGSLTLAYKNDELKNIYQHANNTIEILLRGLQDYGILLSTAIQENSKITEKLTNIGFFISAMCNLVEALYVLQSDVDFVLGQYKNRG